jgi:hypothetical protein
MPRAALPLFFIPTVMRIEERRAGMKETCSPLFGYDILDYDILGHDSDRV